MPIKHSHCSYCGHRFAHGQPWPRRCSGCNQLSFLNPIPVVVTLIPVDRGLMVIRRGVEPHRGELALPGGYLDWGETWQQACAREVREETGLVLPADTFRELRVHSALPGLTLIFAEARPVPLESLPAFAPTDETTERSIIRAPIPLAFDLHTQVAREWFQSQPSR